VRRPRLQVAGLRGALQQPFHFMKVIGSPASRPDSIRPG
jgi:hypothetical protein